MSRRQFLKMAALGTSAAALAGTRPLVARAEEAQFKWRMANLYPRGIAFGVSYQGFADLVKAMSGGRLQIDVVYDGEGVNATEVLGATKTGLVEMGAPYMALHAGELPAGLVELGLPGGPARVDQLLALFYEGGWLDAVRAAYGEQGLHYTGPAFQPGVYILTKNPVNSLADLNGMKLRAPGAYGKFVAEFGVAPVTMSFSEVYTSLATGVIDGCASSNLIDYRDGKFYEQAKHLYAIPLSGAQVAGLIVNQGAWDSLPDDLKAIVDTASVWHGNDQANKSTVWVADALGEMVGNGLQQTGAAMSADDSAKWKAAGEKVWAEYAAADAHSKTLIDLQRSFMSKMAI